MQRQPYYHHAPQIAVPATEAPLSTEQKDGISLQLASTVEHLKGRPQVHVVNVKIQDINMPFWAMVGFMVKLAIASIPAVIIVWILGAIMVVILSIVFGGFLAALSL